MKISACLSVFATVLTLMLPSLQAQGVTAPENLIVGHFGNVPPPHQINKIISAGYPSDILLLAIAPEKLAGFSSIDMQSEQSSLFLPPLNLLPKLGRLAGRGSTLSLESVLAINPDLIIDVGLSDPTYLSTSQKVSQQTGIPYLLISGKLSDSPEQIKQLGALLGISDRVTPLADYAERILQQSQDYKNEHHQEMRFYTGRGPDGLETGFTGSIHTQVAEMLGLKNVADINGFHGISKVSMEQVLLWDPEVIITQDKQFYCLLSHSTLWKNISAVKQKRVFLSPARPFGWVDMPPGINRLLGLRWLQAELSAEPQPQLQQDIKRFFRLFYHIDLTDDNVAALLAKPVCL